MFFFLRKNLHHTYQLLKLVEPKPKIQPQTQPKKPRKPKPRNRPWKKTEDEKLNILYDHLYRVWKTIHEHVNLSFF